MKETKDNASIGQMLAMLLLITAAVEEAEKQMGEQLFSHREDGVERATKEL